MVKMLRDLSVEEYKELCFEIDDLLKAREEAKMRKEESCSVNMMATRLQDSWYYIDQMIQYGLIKTLPNGRISEETFQEVKKRYYSNGVRNKRMIKILMKLNPEGLDDI